MKKHTSYNMKIGVTFLKNESTEILEIKEYKCMW
jgi:hypothetical protein